MVVEATRCLVCPAIESRLRRVLVDLTQDNSTSAGVRERLILAVEKRDYRGLTDIITEQVFPLRFTGWLSLERQIDYCRNEEIDIEVLDANDFRSAPEKVLRTVCARWELPFEQTMLEWLPDADFGFGQMPEQTSWYSRVLGSGSAGVQPPTEVPIHPDRLPKRFQAHLYEARRLYHNLLKYPASGQD